jgi:hypothetical protein
MPKDPLMHASKFKSKNAKRTSHARPPHGSHCCSLAHACTPPTIAELNSAVSHPFPHPQHPKSSTHLPYSSSPHVGWAHAKKIRVWMPPGRSDASLPPDARAYLAPASHVVELARTVEPAHHMLLHVRMLRARAYCCACRWGPPTPASLPAHTRDRLHMRPLPAPVNVTT